MPRRPGRRTNCWHCCPTGNTGRRERISASNFVSPISPRRLRSSTKSASSGTRRARESPSRSGTRLGSRACALLHARCRRLVAQRFHLRGENRSLAQSLGIAAVRDNTIRLSAACPFSTPRAAAHPAQRPDPAIAVRRNCGSCRPARTRSARRAETGASSPRRAYSG